MTYAKSFNSEKAKLVGGLAHKCDNDIIKPRRTVYLKYHWIDVECSNGHAPVT